MRTIVGELWSSTLPIIGSNVLGLVLNFTELYYAGLVGRQALFGVVVAATWTTFASSLALASFTSGVTREVTIRNAQGAPLQRTVWTALVSGVSIGVVAWLGFSLGARALLPVMGLRGESLEHGATFLRVTGAAFPSFFLIGGFQGVMRGIGEPRVAHRIVATAVLLNLALSPVLALRWGLGLGVAGLAVATPVAFAVATGAALAALRRRPRLAALSLTDARWWDWQALGRIARVTGPSASVWLGVSVTIALLQGLMSSLGEEFLVAFSIVLRLEPIAGTLASAFAAAVLHVVGTYYAVGQMRRAFLALRLQQILFVATIAPLILALEAWPRTWAGLFTASPEILHIADLNTRYFLLSLPFIGISQVVGAAFYVFGRPTAGLRIFVVKNLVVLVPSLFVMVWYLGVHDPHVIFPVQLAAAPCAWLYSEALLRRWQAHPWPVGLAHGAPGGRR